jgi:Mrp family chromosome partitioning ATPase
MLRKALSVGETSATTNATSAKLNPLVPRRDAQKFELLREQLCQLVLTLYFREPAKVHSLGLTSAVPGEGKTFLSLLTARVLADERFGPITLVDLNWDHASLDAHFGLPSTPGVAEWLRGEASDSEVCHAVSDTLTVITAGDGKHDTIPLLGRMRQRGLSASLRRSDSFLVVDLPAILTSAYSILAASLVDSLALVVHAGVSSTDAVAEARRKLEAFPLDGVILNQVSSRIPGWIRQML